MLRLIQVYYLVYINMKNIFTFLILSLSVISSTAFAETIFDFEYSSSELPPRLDPLESSTVVSAPATAPRAYGYIVFGDDRYLTVVGRSMPAAALGITDFSITVVGTGIGDGTFGLSDFGDFIWNFDLTPGAVDWFANLVTDSGFFDFNMFNLLRGGPLPLSGAGSILAIPPTGVDPFTIQSGEMFLQATSLIQRTVPVPAVWVLMLVGLFTMRKRLR